MVVNTVDEAQKRIGEIGGFSSKLEEVLQFLLKEHLSWKEASKKENEARKAELEKAAKSLDERLDSETDRLKEVLKRANEEHQREIRDLEAFAKKENAERKAETENINKILNAENEKRMAEAQALKDKMEKEKKELQAYLEKVLLLFIHNSCGFDRTIFCLFQSRNMIFGRDSERHLRVLQYTFLLAKKMNGKNFLWEKS